jgi:hypothetical protein
MQGGVLKKLSLTMSTLTVPLCISVIVLKRTCERANGSSNREEFILYVPSELLLQVEQQVRAEFGDEITSFEWFYEVEFTGIYIEIRSLALQLPVSYRTDEIINESLGEEYIVSLSVSPIESVGCTDGQFNLSYEGGGESYWIDYYAPERPRTNPFVASIYYYTMNDAVRTIHFDSPTQFWERLFRPIHETLASKKASPPFPRMFWPKIYAISCSNS